MDSYIYGEIVPGESAGNIFLGMEYNELINTINFEYTQKDTDHYIILDAEGIRLFILKSNNLLDQITLLGGYKGKLFNKIGIGTIFSNYKELLDYELIIDDNDCNFYSKKFLGIYFQLDGWDDDSSAIKFISINKYFV